MQQKGIVMTVARMVLTALLLAAGVDTAVAQFKARPETKPSSGSSLVRPDGGAWLQGWFDPSRFNMRQSYAISYSSMGGKGISIGEYTNSMMYQISAPLSVQFDVSLTHVPFSSYGDKFSQGLSGLRLSRAQIDYRPSENTLFQVQFRQIPAGAYLRGWPAYGTDLGLDRPLDFDR
jgi:hypothetical protein